MIARVIGAVLLLLLLLVCAGAALAPFILGMEMFREDDKDGDR
jgi:hypothetical protein